MNNGLHDDTVSFDDSLKSHDFSQESLTDDLDTPSELNNQKNAAPRGQKLMMMFFIVLSLIIVAWLLYSMMGGNPATTSSKSDSEAQTNEFAVPDPRRFSDDFGTAPVATTPLAFNPDGTPINPNGEIVLTDAGQIQAGMMGGAPMPPVYQQTMPVMQPIPPVEPVQPYQPPAMMPVQQMQPPQPIQPDEPVKTPEQLRLERQLSAGFTGQGNASSPSGSFGASQVASAEGTAGQPAEKSVDALNSKLQATAISGVAAQRMMNRDYMISAGSMLNCVLETKFNSTQVGMLTCHTTRNIYSASGRVVLIDRGSRIIGQYQGGLQQGQNRVFVLWTRVETPRGVIMNIDSPAAGSLGESGVDGRVNSHFWKRFGGAMLVSVIDGLGKALGNVAAAELNRGLGGENFSNGVTSDSASVAEKVLENTINIPPTLIKHQGDLVNVYVARDLDFSGVYRLR